MIKSYPIPMYPSTCSLIGRFQILSPWGNGISAFPKFASSPAIKYILALVRDTFSTFIFLSDRFVLSIVSILSLKLIILQRLSKKCIKSCTSRISGTLVSVVFHFTSKLADIRGRVAFLLPDIVTLQCNFFHHSIINKFFYLEYKIFDVSL